MGKRTNKMLRLCLALTLVVSCIPAAAYADQMQSSATTAEDMGSASGGSAEGVTSPAEATTGDDPSKEGAPSEVPSPELEAVEEDAIEPMQSAVVPEEEDQATVYSAPAGFTELTNVVRYPNNPFDIRIYSDGLRCGKADSEKVTFKFAPETTADELNYNILSIARQDRDGWNCVYDTSFGQTGLSSSDSFSFNFVSSGTYSLDVQVIAKDLVSSTGGGVGGSKPLYSVRSARIKATFALNDPAYPTTEEVASRVAQQCLDAGNATDYDKAIWLHDWLIEHCRYDHDYNYANAEGALVRGIGTCEAYHRAYVMLLDEVGVASGRITGNGHVWTAVKMNGEWYQVDVTWDDIDYEPHSQFPEERQLYFGLNDSLMGLAHSDHVGPVAGYASNSLKSNYLVKSGAIKKYSSPYIAEIQQRMDAGERSFVLDEANATWPVSLDKARSIVNGIVAYDLAESSWSTNGKSVKLTVDYANGSFSIRAIVDGEIDSFIYYPGLHTKTGALRYGKPNGKYAQNEWLTLNGKTYYFKSDGSAAIYHNSIDGNSYLFWSDHSLARNTLWQGRYYGSDGILYKDRWFDLNGRRYYAHPSGQLAQYATTIGNNSYLFWSDHSLARNQIWNHMHFGQDGAMSKGRWVDFNGRRYFAEADGQLAQYYTEIDNNSYLFWSDHSLARNTLWQGRYYGSDGILYKDRWFDLNGRRYYAKSDGMLAQYQNMIDGKEYLFWSDYSLVRDCFWQGNFYGHDGQIVKKRVDQFHRLLLRNMLGIPSSSRSWVTQSEGKRL